MEKEHEQQHHLIDHENLKTFPGAQPVGAQLGELRGHFTRQVAAACVGCRIQHNQRQGEPGG